MLKTWGKHALLCFFHWVEEMLEDLNRRNKIIASWALVLIAALIVAGACVGLKSSASSSGANSKNILPIPNLSNSTAQVNSPTGLDQVDNGDNGNNQTSSGESHHHRHSSWVSHLRIIAVCIPELYQSSKGFKLTCLPIYGYKTRIWHHRSKNYEA